MIQNLLKQLHNGLSSGLTKLQTAQLPRISLPKQLPKLTLTYDQPTSAAESSNESIVQSNLNEHDHNAPLKKLVVFNSFTKIKQPAFANGKEICLTNNESNHKIQLAKAYVCGPTVYDESHIGHAMTYLRFDLIRRILKRYCSVDLGKCYVVY